MPRVILELTNLRASQIQRLQRLRRYPLPGIEKLGEKDERIYASRPGARHRTTPTRSARRWRWPRPSRASATGPTPSPTRSGGGRAALQRNGAQRAGDVHRADQPVQPDQRGHAPDRRRLDRRPADAQGLVIPQSRPQPILTEVGSGRVCGLRPGVRSVNCRAVRVRSDTAGARARGLRWRFRALFPEGVLSRRKPRAPAARPPVGPRAPRGRRLLRQRARVGQRGDVRRESVLGSLRDAGDARPGDCLQQSTQRLGGRLSPGDPHERRFTGVHAHGRGRRSERRRRRVLPGQPRCPDDASPRTRTGVHRGLRNARQRTAQRPDRKSPASRRATRRLGHSACSSRSRCSDSEARLRVCALHPMPAGTTSPWTSPTAFISTTGRRATIAARCSSCPLAPPMRRPRRGRALGRQAGHVSRPRLWHRPTAGARGRALARHQARRHRQRARDGVAGPQEARRRGALHLRGGQRRQGFPSNPRRSTWRRAPSRSTTGPTGPGGLREIARVLRRAAHFILADIVPPLLDAGNS